MSGPFAGSSTPDLLSASVQSLLESASRLGLTWAINLATVVDPGATSTVGAIKATLDGDTEAITMFSMIGTLVQGQRIYVITVPPAGNYVVGTAGPLLVPILRARVSFVLPGSVLTTVTWTDVDEVTGGAWITVPSTTVTIPTDGIYSLNVVGVFDTVGIANSLQDISIQVLSSVPNWASVPYRDAWSVGEQAGIAAGTTRLNAGDTFTVFMRQNSAVNMNVLGYLTVLRIGD
jgi:hypothetical protein